MNPNDQITNLTEQLEAANERAGQYLDLLVKLYNIVETAADPHDGVAEVFNTIQENRKILPGLNAALTDDTQERMRDVFELTEGGTETTGAALPFNGDLFGGA